MYRSYFTLIIKKSKDTKHVFFYHIFELNTRILIRLGDDSVDIGNVFHIKIIYQ